MQQIIYIDPRKRQCFGGAREKFRQAFAQQVGRGLTHGEGVGGCHVLRQQIDFRVGSAAARAQALSAGDVYDRGQNKCALSHLRREIVTSFARL